MAPWHYRAKSYSKTTPLHRHSFGCRPILPAPLVKEAGEVVAQARAVFGVWVVVPLLEPTEQVGEAGEEHLEALRRPVSCVFGAESIRPQGLSLLQVASSERG